VRRRSKCPEINERHLRGRLEGEINQMCKEGVIYDGDVHNVDCSHPQANCANISVQMPKTSDPREVIQRIGKAGARC